MHLIPPHIEYPDSDGQPMADNTLQYQWIVLVESNLSILFRDRADVFVAGDLLWYPVAGENELRQAPDVLVAFGRPKGHRGSYKQWEENDVPLTVVFEVVSPGNRRKEMENKRLFYEEHGVEEYYLINPYRNTVAVWLRRGDVFLQQRRLRHFVSPRLGIRFVRRQRALVVLGPDGQPFRSPLDLAAERNEAVAERNEAVAERNEALAERNEALEKAANEQRLRQDVQERLARLRELSRKARHGQATPEELAELDRLEAES